MDIKVDDFDGWYEAEHPRLLRALTVAAADSRVAEDCVAEAFARAFARWERVGAMASPGGWTLHVAVNVLRRQQRRRALEHSLLIRSAARQGEWQPELPDLDLWGAVAELPNRQRLAIALRYVSGFTEAEVADAMGVRVGTASATLANARSSLAKRLAPATRIGVES